MRRIFTIHVLILLTLCLGVILSGCKNDLTLESPGSSPEPTAVSATPSPTPIQTAEPEPDAIAISWKFVTDTDNDYQLPYLDIYLIEDSCNPRKTLIYSTIGGIYETSDRSAWNIPDEAENVFYTFYAGAGVHFYTKMDEGNVLTVMYRFIDEMDVELKPFETLISIDYEDEAIVTIENPLDFVN